MEFGVGRRCTEDRWASVRLMGGIAWSAARGSVGRLLKKVAAMLGPSAAALPPAFNTPAAWEASFETSCSTY